MSQPTRPQGSRPPAPSGGGGPEFNLEAIYSMVFRRWKLMLGFLILGAAGAAFMAHRNPLLYTSETRVLILFVLETRSVGPAGPNAPRVTTPDGRGENIMNSEMEILNSTDLATRVAEKLTPERILAGRTGEKTVSAAAAVISHGLEVENPKKSNIIRVSFTHSDPEVVQLVLSELVDAYRSKHIEIRKNGGPMGTWLKDQRDSLARALAETENALRETQSSNGIVSVEDAKHSLVQQVSKLTEDLRLAETQLAEARAMALGIPSSIASNPNGATNTLVFPAEKVEEFRSLLTEEETLKKQEREALRRYTTAHPEVKRIRGLLEETRRQIAAASAASPGLALVTSATPPANPNGGLPAGVAQPLLETDPSRVPALEAKVSKLKSYLEVANGAVKGMVDAELKLSQLKRKKDLQETNFKNYQIALDQVEADEAMGLGKVHNIEVVQTPSLPLPESKARYKAVGIAFALPAFAGIGLAVLLELFLNQKVRRISDVASKISAPVFLAIPELGSGRRSEGGAKGSDRKLLGHVARAALPPAGGEGGKIATVSPAGFPTVREDRLGLSAFFDTLQDRLIAYFDKNGMTRKPKLIGVTGCQSGNGSTTVVTGLAEALSATGEGNVLVVDMTHDGGSMQHFVANKPHVDLSDALDVDKRGEAQVQENLYVVAESGDDEPKNGQIPAVLRKRVMGLIPQLKLSDYDYIIFDLPPMSQTSSAPRLGRLMDLVLLVAQGEKTQVSTVQESAALLEEVGANVGVVLNRTQNHVPKSLRHGLQD